MGIEHGFVKWLKFKARYPSYTSLAFHIWSFIFFFKTRRKQKLNIFVLSRVHSNFIISLAFWNDNGFPGTKQTSIDRIVHTNGISSIILYFGRGSLHSTRCARRKWRKIIYFQHNMHSSLVHAVCVASWQHSSFRHQVLKRDGVRTWTCAQTIQWN